MALGSSAPEILLSIIETLQYINETPGDLGPSTIVGSAAFNFLIITGCCIVAVDGGVKPINDLGVFTITSISSVFAYLWLMFTLSISTPDVVTSGEAWLTFAFFWILIIISYGADRYNRTKKAQMQKVLDSDEEANKRRMEINRARLIKMANLKGESYLLEAIFNPNSGVKAAEKS